MIGCASQLTAERDTWVNYYLSHDYELALEKIQKSHSLTKSKNQLLFYMEQSQVKSAASDFAGAALSTRHGLATLDQLYTKFSDVIGKNALSDQVGDFWGAPYEQSYFYFLSAYNFMRLYQSKLQNKDKEGARSDLFSARASVVAWDAYFREKRNDDELKGIYFADYFQKFYGAHVHEVLGTTTDIQIAQKLYHEALLIFEIQAPSMRAFNSKFETYTQKLVKVLDKSSNVPTLEKMHDLVLSATKEDRVPTEKYQATQKYLKQFVSTKKQKPRKHFLFLEGVIAPKRAKVIDLSLNAALNSGSPSQAVISVLANAAFLVFASRVLNVNSTPSDQFPHPTNVYVDLQVATSLSQILSLKFEMPEVIYQPPLKKYRLRLSNGNKKWERELNLLLPVGEQSYQEVQRDQALRYTKTAVRFALKQAAAMAASFTLYQTMKSNESQAPFAGAAALGTYLSSSYAIGLTEKADTRYWSTIPNHIYSIDLEIPDGIYQAEVLIDDVDRNGSDNKNETFVKSLGQIAVYDNGEFSFLL
ncbi:MAG: hypothetical protein QE271_08585 [Bacteriovoracaceae bacterium]|nr:hypothetical protein [Bacteriovoracaceae bacterium]